MSKNPFIVTCVLGVTIASAPLRADAPELRLRANGAAATPLPGRGSLDAASLTGGTRLPALGDQTVRMAVLLLEFPADTDPNTTGTGRFDLSTSTTYDTNQPPHDHAYFDRQCRSVEAYFTAASGGRLDIDWTIFPSDTDDPPFFEMPNQMRYYNPDTTQAALDKRLAQFFRDGVLAGDAAGVPFDQYDYVVLFHAGVGQDLLFDDPTPSDIPSAFLSLDELRAGLEEDAFFSGIPVQGGTHHVPEGLWLPETENQAGFEFGLTGVFAQLLGSQFGLPILWNPDSGAPGIGDFGLMDQGGGNENGHVPAYPTAWSRFDRGWASAVVVTSGQDLGVVAKGLGANRSGVANELLLIPVDEREYFLVENRKRDLNDDGNVTLLVENTVPIGVLNDEYDFGIPGSGMLVWHIDQGQIDRYRNVNRVNADFEQRGVKLLEADGSDDIGFRPEGGFGLAEDAFYAGNNDALTATTNPSTRSNYGADTHYAITNISARADVMTCDVGNDRILPGWPDSSRTAYAALPPAAGDVDGDGDAEWITIDGTTVVVSDSAGAVQSTFTAPGDSITALLVLPLDTSCAPCADILLATANGGVTVHDGSGALLAQPLAEAVPGEPVTVAAIPVGGASTATIVTARGDEVRAFLDGVERAGSPITGMTNGRTIAIARQGDNAEILLAGDGVTRIALSATDLGPVLAEAGLHAPVTTPPVLTDLDRDGDLDVVTTGDAVRVMELSQMDASGRLRLLPGWPVSLASGPASIADLDEDGRPDVLVGGANAVHALQYNGTRLEGWPVTLRPFGDAGAVTTDVLVADMNGDGRPDVVVPSADGLLRAYDAAGRPLAGWPLAAGRTQRVSPVVSGVAGGSLFAIGVDTPWAYAFAFPDAHVDAVWPRQGGSAGMAGFFDATSLGPAVTSSDLLPDDSVYAYPNPARDALRFRFFLGSAATIAIAIYDVSGAVVATLDAVGQAGVENEVTWTLENESGERVASGIYVAAITARESGRVVRREVPVAIVR